MRTSRAAVDYVRSGRFSQALTLLRARPDDSPAYRLDLAETLLRLGDWADVDKLLHSVLQVGAASARARAVGLRAEFHAYRFELDSAEADFLEAIQLAASSADREFACFLRVRMLAFLGEIYAETRIRRLVEEARQEALSIATPALLGAFHVMAAKFEATHGRTKTAFAHEELATEHLKQQPNPWLGASLALSRSCTSFLLSDLASALQHAAGAQDSARESGDLWSRAAAAANLGFLNLYRGDTKAAEEHLIVARRLTPALPVAQLGVLDTWAQLCLLKGETSEAEAALTQVDTLIRQRPVLRGSWYELGTMGTKVRLLRAARAWTAVMGVADEGAALARARSDENAAALFDCAAAEALLASGDRSGAVERFARGMAASCAAASVRIERNRVRALLHEASGETEDANHALAVADALARHLGDAVSAHEVHKTAAELDAASRVAPDRPESPAMLVPALADVADTPVVFGLVALRLLARSGHLARGAVVRDANGREDVLEGYNWTSETTRAHANVDRRIQLDASTALILSLNEAFQAHCAAAGLGDLVALLERGRKTPAAPETPWIATAYQVEAASAFSSPAMREVLATAVRVAPLDVTVLLTGETGVGKEVLAKSIHDASARSKGPFVPFNCSAVPREMLESQLFGYRRGAFTGAVEPFAGVIRGAERGTLFLDEVGDLPLELQPKLLRFLESREVHPLGEPRPVHVDVRVIAATNARLEERIGQGLFREDLYFRLNTIQLEVPPLRDRREEIAQLASTFLTAHAEEFRKGTLRLSNATLEYLLSYCWPGNVRELSNEMRRVAALAEPNGLIGLSLLSARVLEGRGKPLSPGGRAARPVPPAHDSLPRAVASLERAMIAHALDQCGGRVDEAARLLGISRKGLFLKRKRYGIVPPRES